jgi:hypothetical protein
MSAENPCLSCLPERKTKEEGVVHTVQNPEMRFQRVSHGTVEDEGRVDAPGVAALTDVEAVDEMDAEVGGWEVGGRVLEVNRRL